MFKGDGSKCKKTVSPGRALLAISLIAIVMVVPANIILAEAHSSSNSNSSIHAQDLQSTIPAVGKEKSINREDNRNDSNNNSSSRSSNVDANNNNKNNAINLSNNTGRSSFFRPAALFSNNGFMAASGNNVYVVWADNSTGPLGSIDIMLARSQDKGATFGKPVDLSFPLRNNGSTLGLSHSPQIAVSGNNVYVVWIEFAYAQSGMNLDSAVLYVRSNDGGKTFEGPFNINGGCFGVPEPKTTCLSVLRTDPRIIAAGDHAYVAWTSNVLMPAFVNASEFPRERIDRGELIPADIFFTKISPNGATEPLNISNSTGDSHSPRIALLGSNVYVAWADDTFGSSEILLRKVADNNDNNNGNGSITPEPRTVDVSNSPLQDNEPELAAGGKDIYVIWQQSGRDLSGVAKSSVEFASSQDNGTTFSNPVSIATTTIAPELGPGPSMAVRNNNNNSSSNNSDSSVYAVWTDGTARGQNVYFAKSNGTGSGPFPHPYQILTNNTKAIPFAHIAVSPNGVHVVWAESTPQGTDIFYTESNNFTTLTKTTEGNQSGAGGGVAVMQFSAPVKVSNSTGSSANPQIVATGDNNVYLAWEGANYGGPPDIYFKRMH